MNDPIKEFWGNIVKTEPYWSVLTHDEYKMKNIDLTQFYHTGAIHIKRLINYLKSNNLIEKINTCLDFGCGVGRMTVPLSKVCNSVDAVDLSSGMIDIARKYISDNNIGNVTLIDTSQNDFLPQKQKYDLIFSWAVLQHNPLPKAEAILDKICQSISTNGVAAVYIFSKCKNPSSDEVSDEMQMHDFPVDRAVDIIHKNNCKLVEYNTNELSSLNKERYKFNPKIRREAGYLMIKPIS